MKVSNELGSLYLSVRTNLVGELKNSVKKILFGLLLLVETLQLQVERHHSGRTARHEVAAGLHYCLVRADFPVF